MTSVIADPRRSRKKEKNMWQVTVQDKKEYWNISAHKDTEDKYVCVEIPRQKEREQYLEKEGFAVKSVDRDIKVEKKSDIYLLDIVQSFYGEKAEVTPF